MSTTILPSPSPLTTQIALQVVARRDLAVGVVELTLADPAGAALPPWEPGAHLDLAVGDEVWRSYSLCGPVDAAAWTVAVRLDPEGRGGSRAMHGLGVGAQVSARMPRNHFAFTPAAGPVTFIAGGIGITPLLPMIEAAVAAGLDWTLHYAGRHRETMAYAEELVASYGDRVRLYVSDESGRLDLADAMSAASQVWCCGPAVMIDAAEQAGMAAGVPVHVERFTPKESSSGEATGAEKAFEIEAGGRVIAVPADKTALEVLEDEGFLVLSSCHEGTCGTCETVVLEGEADHRDSILSAAEQAENRLFFPCVSRARSARLVLDLF